MKTNYVMKMLVAVCLMSVSVEMSAVQFWATIEGSTGVQFKSLDGGADNEVVLNSSDANKTSGDVIIPATIENGGVEYTVVGLANWALASKTAVTSVTLPNTIRTIGKEAMKGCTALQSVTIPAVDTLAMGIGVFSGCSVLTELEVPEGCVNTGASMAVDCYALRKVTLPASLTTIGTCAFMDCLALRELHMKTATPPAFEKLWDTFKCDESTVLNADETKNNQYLTDSCVVYVPNDDAVTAYKSGDSLWKNYFKNITTVGLTTSIDDQKATSAQLCMMGQELVIRNIEDATQLAIYSIDGMLVAQPRVFAGEACVNLERGLYIVRINDKAYKVMSK